MHCLCRHGHYESSITKQFWEAVYVTPTLDKIARAHTLRQHSVRRRTAIRLNLHLRFWMLDFRFLSIPVWSCLYFTAAGAVLRAWNGYRKRMDIAAETIFQFLHSVAMDRQTDSLTATLRVRQKQKDSRKQWQKLFIVRFKIRMLKSQIVTFKG
jgi:hypothetical protein